MNQFGVLGMQTHAQTHMNTHISVHRELLVTLCPAPLQQALGTEPRHHEAGDTTGLGTPWDWGHHGAGSTTSLVAP